MADAILSLHARAGTATGQRSAFSSVQDLLVSLVEAQIDPTRDRELRERARMLSGLPLFPSLSQGVTTVIGSASVLPDADEPRLLDVEVVAIYW